MKVSEAEKGLRSKALENNEKLSFKKRAIFLEPPYSWDYLGERGVLIQYSLMFITFRRNKEGICFQSFGKKTFDLLQPSSFIADF